MHPADPMKPTVYLVLSSVSLTLVSCDFNQPLPNNAAYNPLNSLGVGDSAGLADANGPSFAAGTFLQTNTSMAAFYTNFPRPGEQPNKSLANLTDVKVISTKGSYVKVEVMSSLDAGSVGYIPAVMLGQKRHANKVPTTPRITPQSDIPDIQPPEVGDPSQPAE